MEGCGGGGCGTAWGCCGVGGEDVGTSSAKEMMDVERGEDVGDGAVAERLRCCDVIGYAVWTEGICGCVDCERISEGSK